MSSFNLIVNRNDTGSAKWDRRPTWIKKAGYLPLSVADMEFRCADGIVSALTKAAEHGIYGYTDPDKHYYDAVTGWMMKRHSWAIENDWIVCAPGVVPALCAAIQEFTGIGDEVLIQPPVYYPFCSEIKKNGRIVVENTLRLVDGKYCIDFDDLEKKASRDTVKLMFVSNPHNPVGRVFTKEELEKIGNICLNNGVLLVSDEIHFDIIHKPHTHRVMSDISGEIAANTIVCTAPSKSFNLAGLNNANIIIPNKSIRARFMQRLSKNGFSNISYFAYPATIAAYNDNEQWLDNMIQYVWENYQLFSKFFEDNIPDVKVFDLQGTYLAWTDWRAVEKDKYKLETFMLEKACLVLDEGYIFGKAAEGFERFNLAVPRAELIESLTRLLEAYTVKYF